MALVTITVYLTLAVIMLSLWLSDPMAVRTLGTGRSDSEAVSQWAATLINTHSRDGSIPTPRNMIDVKSLRG